VPDPVWELDAVSELLAVTELLELRDDVGVMEPVRVCTENERRQTQRRTDGGCTVSRHSCTA
jgi:hypothetical protein